ncbi:MAG: YceI family protein [Frankia sp.]
MTTGTTSDADRSRHRPAARRGRRSWRRWLMAGVVAVVALAVGGPFVYIHFLEGKAPATLSVATSGQATGPAAGPTTSVEGTWKVASGSLVGYRVKEDLFGQNTTAVGRTSQVTGGMTITGATVTKATFIADMTTVASDRSERDAQFRERIMEVSRYPTARFTLTQPIALGSIPAAGVTVTEQAHGTLTLHGTTRTVTITLTTVHRGSTIQTSSQIPVAFADYNISNPSFGPVTTQNHGILEVLLTLAKS